MDRLTKRDFLKLSGLALLSPFGRNLEKIGENGSSEMFDEQDISNAVYLRQTYSDPKTNQYSFYIGESEKGQFENLQEILGVDRESLINAWVEWISEIDSDSTNDDPPLSREAAKVMLTNNDTHIIYCPKDKKPTSTKLEQSDLFCLNATPLKNGIFEIMHINYNDSSNPAFIYLMYDGVQGFMPLGTVQFTSENDAGTLNHRLHPTIPNISKKEPATTPTLQVTQNKYLLETQKKTNTTSLVTLYDERIDKVFTLRNQDASIIEGSNPFVWTNGQSLGYFKYHSSPNDEPKSNFVVLGRKGIGQDLKLSIKRAILLKLLSEPDTSLISTNSSISIKIGEQELPFLKLGKDERMHENLSTSTFINNRYWNIYPLIQNL